ncbi:MAG TPA: hypothetical protein VMU89_24255 [Thermomicrobiaceae bacterium]|nr:hypothetical protein [Thermomicrobiaceae bacterium]
MYHRRDFRATSEPETLDPGALTDADMTTLLPLRDRYRAAGDLFTARELNRLRFLRWCQLNGRLIGDDGAER